MQKEQLSALMDGEMIEQSLLSGLSGDAELQQRWKSYHLIRDTLRGDVGQVLHLDLCAQIAAAIDLEPIEKVTPIITEAQPDPAIRQKMPFLKQLAPWLSQLTQVSVAACVTLAVVVGMQYFQDSADNPAVDKQSDTPAFNTLPMMGKASPVSFGIPDDTFSTNHNVGQTHQQGDRVNSMLQDFELQRRISAQQGLTAQEKSDSSHSVGVQ